MPQTRNIPQILKEAIKPPRWEGCSMSSQVLVRSDGKIIGRITCAMLSRIGYTAEADGMPLGQYYDEESAKAAVERYAS